MVFWTGSALTNISWETLTVAVWSEVSKVIVALRASPLLGEAVTCRVAAPEPEVEERLIHDASARAYHKPLEETLSEAAPPSAPNERDEGVTDTVTGSFTGSGSWHETRENARAARQISSLTVFIGYTLEYPCKGINIFCF